MSVDLIRIQNYITTASEALDSLDTNPSSIDLTKVASTIQVVEKARATCQVSITNASQNLPSDLDRVNQKMQDVFNKCCNFITNTSEESPLAGDALKSAFELASISGDVRTLVCLVKNSNTTKEMLETALHSCCDHGHTDAAKTLVTSFNGEPISTDLYRSCILAAALSGNSDTFDYILEMKPTDYEFNDKTWRLLVRRASDGGSVEILTSLQKMDSTKFDTHREQGLPCAAFHNQVNALSFLLEGLEIDSSRFSSTNDEDPYQNALDEACGNGSFKALEILISKINANDINAKLYSNLIYTVGRSDTPLAMQFLLRKRADITEEMMKIAFDAAARTGAIACLDAIRAMNLQENEHVIKAAFDAAGRYDKITVIAYLLEKYPAQREMGAQEAFKAASLHGSIEAINYLLDSHFPINQETFNEAVSNAANNKYNVLNRLLETNRPISDEARNHILNKLISSSEGQLQQHIDLIRAIFGRVVTEDSLRNVDVNLRTGALSLAVRLGDVTSVQAILRQGDISEWPLDRTRMLANERGMHEIIALLSQATVRLSSYATIIEGVEIDSFSSSAETLIISLDDIQENPEAILETFCEIGLPSTFMLKDSPAVDVGGISKQVYYSLMKELNKKGLLALTDELLPSTVSENNLKIYKNIGKYISALRIKNHGKTDPFLTGNVFSPVFFKLAQLVCTCASEEELKKQAATVLKDICGEFAKPYLEYLSNPNEETEAAYKTYLTDIGEDIADDPAGTFIEQFLSPARHFVEGCTDAFKAEIRDTEPESLCLAVQGATITAVSVLDSLEIVPVPLAESVEESVEESVAREQQQSRQAILDQKVTWLKEKIQDADPEWLKSFVFTITGRDTISSAAKITIKSGHRDIPEIHTCFSSLAFPPVEQTKEEFLATLEGSLEKGDTGGYNYR